MLRRARARAVEDGTFPFEAISEAAGEAGDARGASGALIRAIREGTLGWNRENLGPLFDRAIEIAEGGA